MLGYLEGHKAGSDIEKLIKTVYKSHRRITLGMYFKCILSVMNPSKKDLYFLKASVILLCHLSTLEIYQKHCITSSTAELDSFPANHIESVNKYLTKHEK